jgi:hypothetical protein
MIFQIGIENNNEGYRSIAWALEHPGCYSYGSNTETALTALPVAISDYAAWIGLHEPSWVLVDQVELHVADTWTDYYIDENFDRLPGTDYYLVDAWFQYDWKPLTGIDIERGDKLLAWSRADLLGVVQGLSATKLDQAYPGERWTINGILKHVSNAERWYLDRIDYPFNPNKNDLLENPFMRLEIIRKHFLDVLPRLDGLQKTIGVDGEFWSPRKVLRRVLWHERDHTEHIRKLIGR